MENLQPQQLRAEGKADLEGLDRTRLTQGSQFKVVRQVRTLKGTETGKREGEWMGPKLEGRARVRTIWRNKWKRSYSINKVDYKTEELARLYMCTYIGSRLVIQTSVMKPDVMYMGNHIQVVINIRE